MVGFFYLLFIFDQYIFIMFFTVLCNFASTMAIEYTEERSIFVIIEFDIGDMWILL